LDAKPKLFGIIWIELVSPHTKTIWKSISPNSQLSQGVHQSDVLVVLATRRVLHRPWCLLEIHEAVMTKLPVVFVQVAGGGRRLLGGFDFEEAA
jgi:hypothetical protein